jgi:hypothetical protein
MSIDFSSVLKSLASTQPLFTSERDLQFALAGQLKLFGFSLNLEYDPGCFDKNASVDIFVTHPELTAIELKYSTVALNHDHISLKEHPSDIARYGVIVDIQRLETVLIGGRAKRGVSVLITNNPTLWSLNGQMKFSFEQFRIDEGRELMGSMSWSDSACAETFKRYPVPVTLRSRYKCAWFDFIDLHKPKGLFRCLLTEVALPAT